jgi:hypothetical protein
VPPAAVADCAATVAGEIARERISGVLRNLIVEAGDERFGARKSEDARDSRDDLRGHIA